MYIELNPVRHSFYVFHPVRHPFSSTWESEESLVNHALLIQKELRKILIHIFILNHSRFYRWENSQRPIGHSLPIPIDLPSSDSKAVQSQLAFDAIDSTQQPIIFLFLRKHVRHPHSANREWAPVLRTLLVVSKRGFTTEIDLSNSLSSCLKHKMYPPHGETIPFLSIVSFSELGNELFSFRMASPSSPDEDCG